MQVGSLCQRDSNGQTNCILDIVKMWNELHVKGCDFETTFQCIQTSEVLVLFNSFTPYQFIPAPEGDCSITR